MSLSLTPIQQKIVSARGKNILVAAGAGTGKTRVLVERFIDLLRRDGMAVEQILALTFTEKAANEMKSRLQDRLEELGMEKERRDLERAYISTIHAFASRILREHPLEAGMDPEFRVIENEEVQFLKEDVLTRSIESLCRPETGVLELLRLYGEQTVRDGVLNIYHKSRNQGTALEGFFKTSRDALKASDCSVPFREAHELFTVLGEEEYASQLAAFHENRQWTWETVDDFKNWQSLFSRKRGKKGDDSWARIKAACKTLLAMRLEGFLGEWMDAFECLTLEFERSYQAEKNAQGVVDFDDLQMKILTLFKTDAPVQRNLLERYRRQFRQIMIDEYQDTDYLQDELIDLLGSGDNLFFVGDYKQSIYGFRGAEPQLFLEKQRVYQSGEKGVHIELRENFRTVPETLQILNRFFETLWEEDDFNYDSLFENESKTGESGVEILALKPEKGEAMNMSRLKEAERIAAKVRELHKNGRPYGEMAILFEAMTNAGIYEQALKKYNIPYYAVSSRGFYHQPEIRDMVSFLNFLDNPLADIALAASLRSPFFQIRDDTLYRLAVEVKENLAEGAAARPLFYALEHSAVMAGIPEEQKQNLERFKQLAGELLAVKDRLRLSEFIDLILKKTSCELILLADEYGVRKYANLKKLIAIAREFETRGPLSLHGFLKALKRLESQEVRESEAQIEAEASGEVVRLMTVHRSKGLEFPVVFIADMGHQGRSQDTATFLAEVHQGYAMKLIHPVSGEKEEPYRWQQINTLRKQKDAEEWKRLFYVAATRVEEKLILSGVYNEDSEAKESFHAMNTWMKWVMASFLSEMETESPAAAAEEKSAADCRLFTPALFEQDPVFKEDRSFLEQILEQVKPRESRPARVIDLPVSAYAAYEKDKQSYWAAYEVGMQEGFEIADLKDARPEPSEIDWADFGTRMHLALERMDFRKTTDNALKDNLAHCFRNTPDAWAQEALKILKGFCKTETFRIIQSAKKIYRELPFVLNGRHGIVHGIVDLLIEDADGRLHIIDYKTAEGSAEKIESSGYRAQLKLYAHAVSRLLGRSPAHGTLYFLKNDWSYTVSWNEQDLKEIGEWADRFQEEILNYRPS